MREGGAVWLLSALGLLLGGGLGCFERLIITGYFHYLSALAIKVVLSIR